MSITRREDNSQAAAQPVLETIKINLGRYAEEMGNDKAAVAEVGIRMQRLMLSTLKLIFRLEDEAFNEGFDLLVKWAKQHIKGCMKREARYRFLHMCKSISKADHSAILLVVGLVTMIADDKARNQVISRFDFHRLDKFWTTDGGGDKLANYFASRSN